MHIKIPDQFPLKQNDTVLNYDNQTFIQFHRKTECYKRPVELEQHLVMVILKGKKVMISTEQDITVEKNELLFLQKGSYLTSEIIKEEGEFSSLLFFVQDDFLKGFKEKHQQYLSTTKEGYVPKMFKVGQSDRLEAYIQSLLPYFNDPQGMATPLLQLKIEELLLSLLFSSKRSLFNSYLLGLGKDLSSSFKEKVEQSMFKNLTVEERAFLSNQSVSSFKRKFKAVFQDTPAHWLREQRLQRAKVLINSTEKTIADIAFEVGYESPSHFIHLYKKKYGITPKQHSSKYAIS